MDHESTTAHFRERYINVLRESAMPYLWPAQRATIRSIGEALNHYDQLATSPAAMAQWVLAMPGMSFDDRRRAISIALDEARAGDSLLIAGKGHEGYQEFADTVIPFDDRQVVRELIGVKALRP